MLIVEFPLRDWSWWDYMSSRVLLERVCDANLQVVCLQAVEIVRHDGLVMGRERSFTEIEMRESGW